MLVKEKIQQDIINCIAILERKIEISSKNNLNNINVNVEELITGLFNILHGCNLVYLGKQNPLFPGIDALDKVARIGLQITHDKTSAKINETIKKIRDNNLDANISELYIFVTQNKQNTNSVNEKCKGVSFNPKTNIKDFRDIHKLVSADTDTLHAIDLLLKKEMGDYYSGPGQRNQAILDNIVNARSQLDRGVFLAGFHAENPEEMLRSLKEMQVEIQKSRVMNDSTPVLSKAFKEILRITRAAENKVAELYQDGYRRYKAGISPAWEGDEYGKCVTLLMNIRHDVMAQIDLIDEERIKFT